MAAYGYRENSCLGYFRSAGSFVVGEGVTTVDTYLDNGISRGSTNHFSLVTVAIRDNWPSYASSRWHTSPLSSNNGEGNFFVSDHSNESAPTGLSSNVLSPLTGSYVVRRINPKTGIMQYRRVAIKSFDSEAIIQNTRFIGSIHHFRIKVPTGVGFT